MREKSRWKTATLRTASSTDWLARSPSSSRRVIFSSCPLAVEGRRSFSHVSLCCLFRVACYSRALFTLFSRCVSINTCTNLFTFNEHPIIQWLVCESSKLFSIVQPAIYCHRGLNPSTNFRSHQPQFPNHRIWFTSKVFHWILGKFSRFFILRWHHSQGLVSCSRVQKKGKKF